MNILFKTRNNAIESLFRQLYGTMPTMLLYAHIGEQYQLSEESIRKIIRKSIRN